MRTRGIKHRLLCVSNEAEVIMLITPPGLEHFFDAIDQQTSEGPADPAKMKELAAEYGVEILPEG
ncbi:MAG: hypothetical protein AAF266_14550 [Planctomycetota bacterium]